jgi:hypothetical protein
MAGTLAAIKIGSIMLGLEPWETILYAGRVTVIFILRWFWWRINAWSEISAMIVSGIVSLLFSSKTIGGHAWFG